MEVAVTQARFYYNGAARPHLYHKSKPLTVFLLTGATAGFYVFWWHYNNWRIVARNTDFAISPAARAFFHWFFAYSLYDTIAATATSTGIRGAAILRVLGVFHFVNLFAGDLPVVPSLMFAAGPVVQMAIALLFVAPFLDPVYVQHKINRINRTLGVPVSAGFERVDALLMLLVAVEVFALYAAATWLDI